MKELPLFTDGLVEACYLSLFLQIPIILNYATLPKFITKINIMMLDTIIS